MPAPGNRTGYQWERQPAAVHGGGEMVWVLWLELTRIPATSPGYAIGTVPELSGGGGGNVGTPCFPLAGVLRLEYRSRGSL